jgi:putative transposase
MTSATYGHLPRLLKQAYQGRQFVHWTMTVADRLTGWLTPDFHTSFRAILSNHVPAYGVVVPAYCLMPDHLHVMAAGVSVRSYQILWSRATRRAINQAIEPGRLQKQAYDHVLRPAESGPDAFTALVHYISENPVRAGLVGSARDWPYVGSVVPAVPRLNPREEEFRERWWAYWNNQES